MPFLPDILLAAIKCPLCKGSLAIFSDDETSKPNIAMHVDQTKILHCACGMLYPVIKNIPRLSPDSFLDYEEQIDIVLPDYSSRKKTILDRYGMLIMQMHRQNKSVKKSFSFEWSLLKENKSMNVWDLDKQAFEQQLWEELDVPPKLLEDSIVADVGCGHGRSGKLMAAHCSAVFCIDVGLSIEEASKNNPYPNCFFIQADLHYLPFQDTFFDLIYSSGVLHHNENTAAAFKQVAKFVKPGGLFCVWLYHPFNNTIHKIMRLLRKGTVHLPVRMQFWLYMIFLLPVHKTISFLKGNKKHWREIMINQMDMLSPKYRHEHTHAAVEEWYKSNRFTNVKLTTTNDYGFSMKGIKQQA